MIPEIIFWFVLSLGSLFGMLHMTQPAFWREWMEARELTTLIGDLSFTLEDRLREIRRGWGWLQVEAEPEVPEIFEADPLASGAFGVVDGEGRHGEIAPDAPPLNELSLTTFPSRRAQLFAQYWVSRVHERFPAVVGSWDRASLACTRLWLCKEMRADREYTTSRRGPNGEVVREVKHRRGMHTHQISACVDWIVTLAHRGTLEQQALERVRASMQPNWFMRLLGYKEPIRSW